MIPIALRPLLHLDMCDVIDISFIIIHDESCWELNENANETMQTRVDIQG
jgi:hypothetical protein